MKNFIKYYICPLINIFFLIITKIFLKKKYQFRVIMYHDIKKNNLRLLYNQLFELQKEWRFIHPKELSTITKKNYIIKENLLLLTVDDGFFSSKLIATKVLEKLNIKGVFFCVTNFLDIKNRNDALNFSVNRIKLFPEDKNSKKINLDWNDARFLLKKGHTIGAHTITHQKLSELNDYKKIKEEIVKPQNIMKNKLGVKIKHFAFTFGDITCFNPKSYLIAKKNYNYVFSAVRGNNYKKNNKHFYYRDELNPLYSANLVNFFLNGMSYLYYYFVDKKFLKYK